MKPGDLVKVYYLGKPSLGIVLEVRRKICTVMTQDRGINDYPKGHVSRDTERLYGDIKK